MQCVTMEKSNNDKDMNPRGWGGPRDSTLENNNNNSNKSPLEIKKLKFGGGGEMFPWRCHRGCEGTQTWRVLK